MKQQNPLYTRRKRLGLTQQKAADAAHMPVLLVVLLENPAKIDEYRTRLAESYRVAESRLLEELQAA